MQLTQAHLEAAIRLATTAHAGQVDKSGNPYILHPLRVMIAGKSLAEQIVGVLHDVLEDSEIPASYIRQEFGDEILNAVSLLTRAANETYEQFIAGCATSQLALRVKINDITDNLRPIGRDMTRADIERRQRYHDALAYLIQRKDI